MKKPAHPPDATSSSAVFGALTACEAPASQPVPLQRLTSRPETHQVTPAASLRSFAIVTGRPNYWGTNAVQRDDLPHRSAALRLRLTQ